MAHQPLVVTALFGLLSIAACGSNTAKPGAIQTDASQTDAGLDAASTDSGSTDAGDQVDSHLADTTTPADSDAVSVDISDVPADSAADSDSSPTADSNDGTVDTSEASDAPQPVDVSADTGLAPDASSDTLAAAACADLGGVCLGMGGDCVGGKGTPAVKGDSVCGFDDGPGSCCIPPPLTQAKATCADFGGVCAPIGGCNMVGGAFAPATGCGMPPMICCVPHSICGEETVACCDNMTTYHPYCDHGTWTCEGLPGTLKPVAQCPK